MTLWKAEISKILKLISADPSGSLGMAAGLVIGFLACLFAVSKVATMMKYPMNDFKRSFSIVIIACVLLLAVAAAVDIYIVPTIKAPWRVYLPLIADVVVLLVAVVPLAWFLHRSSYVKALNVLIIGMATGAVAILLTHGAFQAIKQGGKGFDKTRERTEGVNDAIK